MTLIDSLSVWSRWIWPLVADHLWQSTAFAVLVWVVAFFLRRGPARARYAVWLAASAKIALPTVAQLLSLLEPLRSAVQSAGQAA